MGAPAAMNFQTIFFDVLGSTNTEALEQARRGADEGLIIVAREQTAGRGRLGRKWASPRDAGLYFSIVLRPSLEPRFLPLITLAAGVAVHETLTSLGLSPDIKWVNDVLVHGRKISGILAETAETNRGTAVVVGIGINITSENFPEEIAKIATSIEGETGRRVSVEDLAKTLAGNIETYYEILLGAGGPQCVVKEWSCRSTYVSGKHVRVTAGNEMTEGITEGLEPNGALRIRTNDVNALAIIQTGDVQALRDR
ncbi:MAG: biotin--[acetyl-CoA-carboxylase] ligase [Blastocatellia bacterium]|nr:biotin--[acetyl-CoA-carboxylase] ligase [Blastocatellia bacterium]